MRLLRHFLKQRHAITVRITEESDTLHVLREVDQRIDKAGDGAFSFVLSNDWLHDCVIWKKQVGVTGVISIPSRQQGERRLMRPSRDGSGNLFGISNARIDRNRRTAPNFSTIFANTVIVSNTGPQVPPALSTTPIADWTVVATLASISPGEPRDC